MSESPYRAIPVDGAGDAAGAASLRDDEDQQQLHAEFHYTLVFVNTKCPEYDRSLDRRISFAEAREILRCVTSGGREKEKRTLREFQQGWIEKFRTSTPIDTDTVPFLYFQELFREVIIQRFDAIDGLYMRTFTSEDQRHIILALRSSKALLAATAHRMNTKIPIMTEVDPGEKLWADAERSEQESRIWTKADAQEELYRMFLAGLIPTEEAQVFDDETPSMWSKRLNALLRFSDPTVAAIVADQQKHAAAGDNKQLLFFLPFRNRPCLQYLYRHIDSDATPANGVMPFRIVDKIRLTKGVIDAEFDCDSLVKFQILANHFCTHTYVTNSVDTSIAALRHMWGSIWSPFRCVLQFKVATLSEFFFFQPLVHIRNYFGEELAMYCAFTSCYAQHLQLLCVAAIVLFVVELVRPQQQVVLCCRIAFCLVNCLFIQRFVRRWLFQESLLATSWGVNTSDGPESNDYIKSARPQFRGEMRFSEITHRMELYTSPSVQRLKKTISCLLLALVVASLFVAYMLLMRFCASHGMNFYLILALSTKFMAWPLSMICKSLNEWENYRTQDEYDVMLTLKFALVQTANSYGVLWYLTFVAPWTSETCQRVTLPVLEMPCFGEAASLLRTLLLVDLVLSALELRHALWEALSSEITRFALCWLSLSTASPIASHEATSVGPSSDKSLERLLVHQVSPALKEIETEWGLDPYDGVLFDYAQIFGSFGLITWFAALFPLGSLYSWIVVVLQIRIDSFKLCFNTQRPFPTPVDSIGSWKVFLQVLSVGSVLHNAAIATMLALSRDDDWTAQRAEDTPNVLFSLFMGARPEDSSIASVEETALEFFCVFIGLWMLMALEDPEERSMRKRLFFHAKKLSFLENKYILNVDRISDDIRDSLPCGAVFLNGVRAFVVTGNKEEEDEAEEIIDDLAHFQRKYNELEREIIKLRPSLASRERIDSIVLDTGIEAEGKASEDQYLAVAGGDDDCGIGRLTIEVQSINILPVMDTMSKTADPFVTARVQPHCSSSCPPTKAKTQNTSVIRKTRTPEWNELLYFRLPDLNAKVFLTVFDWERMGDNRRIGSCSLSVADILKRMRYGADSSSAIGSTTATTQHSSSGAATTTLAREASDESGNTDEDDPSRMVPFSLPLEMTEKLYNSLRSDLVKYGAPKLAIRAGVCLDAVGKKLFEQQLVSQQIEYLKEREKQFFEWK